MFLFNSSRRPRKESQGSREVARHASSSYTRNFFRNAAPSDYLVLNEAANWGALIEQHDESDVWSLQLPEKALKRSTKCDRQGNSAEKYSWSPGCCQCWELVGSDLHRSSDPENPPNPLPEPSTRACHGEVRKSIMHKWTKRSELQCSSTQELWCMTN